MFQGRHDTTVYLLTVANGGNVIDTARCYGENVTNPPPESEHCIGSWLQSSGIRDKIVLITKGGNPEYKNGEHIRNRITAEDIEADITKSLEALKTDYIDIYFFHKDDPTVEPGAAIEILNQYVKSGVVKHIGASNWTAERIKAANKYAKKHGLAEFEYSEIAFSLKDRVTKGWGEKELAHEMDFEDYQYYSESGMPVIGFGAQAYGFFYGNDIPGDASEKNREICGKEYSVEEIFEKIICDKRFYENSGGGATFSGGECMLQPDFLCEILKNCKDAGIHTSVDTAGHIDWKAFERVLPYTDLFLYDIKAFDSDVHRKYTGVSNKLILENLKNLFESGANVWIRIPVIPEVNDTIEEMQNIKNFLAPYNPLKIELLPYHGMGENKYEALGMKTTSFDVPDQKIIAKLKKILKSEEL